MKNKLKMEEIGTYCSNEKNVKPHHKLYENTEQSIPIIEPATTSAG